VLRPLLFFPFVYESLRHGALGSFLLLLLALLWRYRDRAVVAGAALAFAVVLKLFLWPSSSGLLAWLALTRRFRAAAIAVAGSVCLALLSWAAIDFAGLRITSASGPHAIVWLHYFILLIVPIALARPRLSPLWFLPLALWPLFWLDEYRSWPDGDIDALAAAIGLACALCTLTAARPRQRPSRAQR